VPVYDLTVASRLLPLGPSRGYGYVAEEVSRSLDENVRSSVRLSADGQFLYLDGGGRVYSVDYGGATPRQLEPGDAVMCGDLRSTWEPFAEGSEGLSRFFCGQIVFDNPVTRRLASRDISVPLREAFVANHDEMNGRARLVSPDGFNFLVRFAESAGEALVWIKPNEGGRFLLHTGGNAGWKFDDSPVEFVVGTTRFRLDVKGGSD
jgi:hypothetical protein